MPRTLNEFEEGNNVFASKFNENFNNLQLDIGDVASSLSSLSSTVNSLSSSLNTLSTKVSSLLPVGTIVFFGADEAPTGYLICNGAAISRNDYADLFAKINTAFGTGDGSTTFNIPDLIGKVAYGSDTLNSNSFKTDVEDTVHSHSINNAAGGYETKHTNSQNTNHKHTIPAVGLLPCIKY